MDMKATFVWSTALKAVDTDHSLVEHRRSPNDKYLFPYPGIFATSNEACQAQYFSPVCQIPNVREDLGHIIGLRGPSVQDYFPLSIWVATGSVGSKQLQHSSSPIVHSVATVGKCKAGEEAEFQLQVSKFKNTNVRVAKFHAVMESGTADSTTVLAHEQNQTYMRSDDLASSSSILILNSQDIVLEESKKKTQASILDILTHLSKSDTRILNYWRILKNTSIVYWSLSLNRRSMQTLGLHAHAARLGHNGANCPNPQTTLPFTVVDTNSIHATPLAFCGFLKCGSKIEQLMTAFTFAMLNNFHIHMLESKKVAYDYLGALRQLMDNSFTADVHCLTSDPF
ncbi:hypothetical protein L208DRAFT_1380924 [Tricholoma matsutake]|nr:hypothetical protein L208DRAFT_1380924 [Tricholoma matsutake 945]